MIKVLLVKTTDKRMEYLKKYLESKTEVLEINDELELFYGIENEECKYLILPVRGVNKEGLIDGTNIKLTDSYLGMLKNKTIFTGLISDELKDKCDENKIRLLTYLNDDVAIKNNYITTEGIIETIVSKSEKAIYNSRILVIGYGRLGMICANVLKSLKAQVDISCRHEKDIIHAKIHEFNIVNFQQIISIINQYDFIINTVPYRIIDSAIIRNITNPDLLIIDVSSSPYGLDHDLAKSLNIKTLLLPGIPGKIAPKTAGTIIGETIYQDIIGGEGVGG